MSKLAERHALVYDGAAVMWRTSWGDRGYWAYGPRLGRGRGPAACHCGQTSPLLDGRAARRRWHRQHKAEALGQAGGQ